MSTVGQYTLVFTAEYKTEWCLHKVATLGGPSGDQGGRVEVYDETTFTVRIRTYDTNGQLYNPPVITYMLDYVAPIGQAPTTVTA